MQKDNFTEINFRLSQDTKLALVTDKGVFLPTQTTSLLIQAVATSISGKHTVLDLGCGTGVVGLSLYLRGLVRPPIFASDLSISSVRCCQSNCARHACEADVRIGSLFEPWVEEQFDIIVNDVSGISQEIAVVSPWFQGVPCDTGSNGLALVASIMSSAPHHLNKGGRFFFPVLSLSDVDLLLKQAADSFTTVEKISRQEWPLPFELMEHLPLLRKLANEGSIQLQERFGMVTCYTEIYCAFNS